jgi:hypothetical protein
MLFNEKLKLAAAIAALTLAPHAWAQGVKVNGKEIPQSRIDAGVKSRVSQGSSEARAQQEARRRSGD